VQALRKKEPGYKVRVAGVLVAAPLLSWFALNYFPQGYSWSQEVSLLMLMWVGFLGASICAHEGKHIRMEALQRVVPPRIAKWVLATGFLFTAGFTGFLALLGYQYTFDETAGAMVLGGVFEQTGIPDWLAIVAVPMAFALATLRFVAAAISTVMGGDYGQPISEEDEARAAAEAAAAAGGPAEPTAEASS
jgi:TRAP-type C4-dicarboxylate transport system permease small subunit